MSLGSDTPRVSRAYSSQERVSLTLTVQRQIPSKGQGRGVSARSSLSSIRFCSPFPPLVWEGHPARGVTLIALSDPARHDHARSRVPRQSSLARETDGGHGSNNYTVRLPAAPRALACSGEGGRDGGCQ